MNVKRYLIVDFNNIFHQAHVPWTYKEPSDSNNAVIFNFIRMLDSTIKELEVTDLVFCFEGSDQVRRDIFENYKNNRKKDKSDPKYIHFVRQLALLKENIGKIYRCTAAEHSMLESDDTIFEMVNRINDEKQEGDIITILSSDKDMIQCLRKDDDTIKLYCRVTKSYRDYVNDSVLHKALTGDKSDNITGIYRIGKAKADKIIENGFDEWLSTQEEHIKRIVHSNISIIKLFRWDELPEKYQVNYFSSIKSFSPSKSDMISFFEDITNIKNRDFRQGHITTNGTLNAPSIKGYYKKQPD